MMSVTSDHSESAIFDVERQLKATKLAADTRAGGGKTERHGVHTPWLNKGSQEGYFPTVIVRNATLGMVGKAGDGKRGFTQYTFKTNGGPDKTQTRIAIGLEPNQHDDLQKMLCGILDKLIAMRHPVQKSMYYQMMFPTKLLDGTQVFNATAGLTNPSSFAEMQFEDSDTQWDSPGRTWGPFLYGGEEAQSSWYPKVRVDDQSQVFLMNSKKKQFQRTSENEQIVYPRDGIQVGNHNMLNTLLSSELYKGKQWRANLSLQVTGIEFKCGQTGTTMEGNPRYGISPVFSMKAVGPIALQEHSQAVEEGGMTPDQLMAAQMAAVFEGMTTPNRKRKIKDQVHAPLKVSKSTHANSVADDKDTEESEEEGEM